MNAIRNINKSLQEAPSDYLMVAVASMTLLEVSLVPNEQTIAGAKPPRSAFQGSPIRLSFTEKAFNSWFSAGVG
jgi:hypothetical protein